jgi:hypothetical protein
MADHVWFVPRRLYRRPAALGSCSRESENRPLRGGSQWEVSHVMGGRKGTYRVYRSLLKQWRLSGICRAAPCGAALCVEDIEMANHSVIHTNYTAAGPAYAAGSCWGFAKPPLAGRHLGGRCPNESVTRRDIQSIPQRAETAAAVARSCWGGFAEPPLAGRHSTLGGSQRVGRPVGTSIVYRGG